MHGYGQLAERPVTPEERAGDSRGEGHYLADHCTNVILVEGESLLSSRQIPCVACHRIGIGWACVRPQRLRISGRERETIAQAKVLGTPYVIPT